MTKYKYTLKNLDCANCAREIEEHLKKDKNLSNVIVNYSKLSLSFEANLQDVKKYVSKKVNEVEPEVTLLDNKEENNTKKEIIIDSIKLVIGILLTLIGTLCDLGVITKIVVILAYIILLYEIFIKAIKLLFKSFTINENLLITISCIGAYFTGNIAEGLMVIILYQIGEILEHLAVNNSRKSIANLMDIKPVYANLKVEEEIKSVNPTEVKVGDIIVIRKGERIPLDGIITKGETSLDTSALNGESKPKFVKINDEVLSGSINLDEVIELEVTTKYEDSTVSRILELVENATDRKAKTENFVSRAAKIYTPIVIVLAILVVLTFPTLLGISFNDAIYRALSFLVISCPCAIAISVPLSYFSGIGAASKNGILIKGSDYLDGLKDINKIIFDKTGTITTGKFDNINLRILNDSYKEKDIINYYLKGESFSTHPLATSIQDKFNKKVKTNDVKNFKEISGKGLSYEIDNKKVLIGSASLVKSKYKDNSIYLKVNNDIIAKLEISDSIKPGIKETINKLNKMNIATMMFTGDEKSIAESIAKETNIKDVKYELLPEDKYNLLEQEIKINPNKTAFIGDGINDAPSLARADIGISMGSVGSASAIEASDVVIINDDINKIIDAINISKKTDKIIKENLLFAIGIKILVLTLTAIGISSMWQAVFADTGVTLLTIINTTRILKYKKR